MNFFFEIFAISLCFIYHGISHMVISDTKYSKRTTLLVWGALLVGVTALSILLRLRLTFTETTCIVFFVSILAYYIAFLKLSNGSVLKKTFMFSTYVNLFLFGFAFSFFFTRYIVGFNAAIFILAFFGYYLILWFCYTHFVKTPFREIAHRVNKEWRFFIILPFASITLILLSAFALLHFENIPSMLQGFWFFVLFATIFALYITVFQTISFLQQTHHMKQQLLRNDFFFDQMRLHEELYDTANRSIATLRAHNACLRSYAQDGALNELIAYLDEQDAQLRSQAPSSICTNPLVNAVLYTFLHRTQENKIALSLDLHIADALPMRGSDLIAILSSVLETAFLACTDESVADPKIALHMSIKHKKLILTAKCTCTPALDGVCGDNDARYGALGGTLYNMRTAAQACNAITDCSANKGIFTLKILIPL